MSHALGGKMFNNGTKPIEFRELIVFKNFKAFAWALKDFCIQGSLRGLKYQVQEKKGFCLVVMQISAHFTVYAVLQNRGKCFQIRSLCNIHACKGLDDNPKVTKAWIVRKYRNKVLVDPRIGVDMLTDYMKKMYRVIVAP